MWVSIEHNGYSNYGEVQHKLGRRLMLANPGETVENKGNESRKWAILAEVSFFEQEKGNNSGYG